MTVAKRRYTRAAAARVVPTDSATENQTAGVSQEPPARVKRCGKSAPREAQATRHGKPHRVQGQIGNPGAARSSSAKADGFRVSAAQTNDSLRSQGRRQNSAYSPSKTILDLRMTIYDLRIPRKLKQLRCIL